MDDVNLVKEKYEGIFNENVAVVEKNDVIIVVPHCLNIDDI